MRAAVYEGIENIQVKDVPVPELPEDGIKVRVGACAICGSDLRIYHHGHGMITPPQVVGHEICGEIVEVGSKVTKFKVGQRVAVGADSPCGKCDMCEIGLGTYCRDLNGVGYTISGGFAEYCVFPGFMVANGPIHVVPDHVSDSLAALAEPLGCILNGMERIQPKMNDVAVIIGAGPVGCMMIPVLYHLGVSKVIMMDLDEKRLELAKRMGADRYVCTAKESGVDVVMEETDGRGADIVITANSAWPTHVDALKMAAIRARVCYFCGLPSGTLVPQYDTNVIHYKELLVVGAHGAMPRHHKMALDMISSGKLPIEPIITHEFPLSKFNEGLAAAESKGGLKVVINPRED